MATNAAFPDVKPFPEQGRAPVADRLHNKPPLAEIIPAEFREALLAERPDFLTKMDDLVGKVNPDPEKASDLGAVARVKVSNDEELARAGTMVKILRAAITHVEATHKAVKQPHLDAGRLVDAEKNALMARLTEGKNKVEEIGNEYIGKREAALKAERDRLAAEQRAAAEAAERAETDRRRAEEEAERAVANAASDADRVAAQERADEAAVKAEAAMAAAALAPAAPTKSEPVRSDEGATVSGKQDWKSEVSDYTVAFIAVEDNPKVREAIDKAIAALVRAGKRQIEGVKIWPVAKANFR